MKDMVKVTRGKNIFQEQPAAKIGRSQIDRSHALKMGFDASYLYPIFIDEILPGDTMTMRLNGFARIFSPLDAPMMDNIEFETFFFFVPNRLIWNKWEDFMGAHQDAGAQDTDFTIPILNSGAVVSHESGAYTLSRLMAAFGLPDGLAPNTLDVNALPFRGYNLIYNDWFRDQNLIDKVDENQDNGPDTGSDYVILKSAKKHDYFTGCLPYLQKGDPVTIGIGTTAPIMGIGVDAQTDTTGPVTAYETDVPGGDTYTDYFQSSIRDFFIESDGDVGNPNPIIYADLSAATGVTVNDLRQSVAIQRLLERNARGGTRYTEIIKSHFGVTSPDFRMQRPEYLGGGKSFINVSPVANTSATAGEDQGELRGIGTGVINGHGWAKSFTEHGYVIGLVRARGDVTYFQGLERLWSRSTLYDFYVPALANLGEQAILNKELFYSGDANDDMVFGYQERWAEYRYKPSRIVGDLNPDVSTGSLAFWHLAEDFASLPGLNQVFIEDQTPMDRVTTTTGAHHFLMDVWFEYKCARPIPVRSIPSLTERF